MDGGGRQDRSYPVTCADIALSVIRVVRRYDYIETLPWWLLPPPIMGLADRVLRVRSYKIVGIDFSLEERPGDRPWFWRSMAFGTIDTYRRIDCAE